MSNLMRSWRIIVFLMFLDWCSQPAGLYFLSEILLFFYFSYWCIDLYVFVNFIILASWGQGTIIRACILKNWLGEVAVHGLCKTWFVVARASNIRPPINATNREFRITAARIHRGGYRKPAYNSEATGKQRILVFARAQLNNMDVQLCMGACCGAAHHIYNNLGKPQPATSIDEHSGCQPQPAASMDGKGTCQTLMFYMTLVRHVPKCILSKTNGFVQIHMFFVRFIDVGIDVPGSFVQKQWFFVPKHVFRWIYWCGDWFWKAFWDQLDIPRPIWSQLESFWCLSGIREWSFAVGLIISRRDQNTTPARSPIRTNWIWQF